jgi:sugar phosphate isomerase/epimerase
MVILSAFADEISADPIEQLDLLSELGIKHIEFRSIDGTNVLDLSWERHEEFRRLLTSYGFGLSAIGSPIGKIQIGDDFETHLKRYEHALRVADFYSTPRIRIFSYYLPKEDDPAIHRDEVLRRMKAKATIAEKSGVTLLLENERYIYGDTAARVLDVLNSVNSPSLSHAFDPANYVEIGEPILKAWEILKPYTTHFHVKDYDPLTRKNVPTGEGEGHIPELIADAVAGGYQGFCVLEPHLLISELTHGFTGPVRFRDAALALTNVLNDRGIAYR